MNKNNNSRLNWFTFYFQVGKQQAYILDLGKHFFVISCLGAHSYNKSHERIMHSNSEDNLSSE